MSFHYRYQEGVRTASYGFLEFFVFYLLFSFVQQRVLAIVGESLTKLKAAQLFLRYDQSVSAIGKRGGGGGVSCDLVLWRWTLSSADNSVQGTAIM